MFRVISLITEKKRVISLRNRDHFFVVSHIAKNIESYPMIKEKFEEIVELQS